VLTAFGRRYPLPDIQLPKFDKIKGMSNGRLISAAERNAVNSPVQGCLHPNTRVITDSGMTTVGDLWKSLDENEQARFKIWTGCGWSDARVFPTGGKRLCHTRFHDGNHIETSPDHRFRVWRDGVYVWVRQEDLRVGDYVATDKGGVLNLPQKEYSWQTRKTVHNIIPYMSKNGPELWEVLGYAVGDGWVGLDKMQISFGGEEAKSHVDQFAHILSVAGIAYTVGKISANGNKLTKYQVSLKTDFVRFVSEVLGLKSGNAHTKRFPKAVWSETTENQCAFLRGYFSSDGTVSANGDSISVRSVNHGLLRDTFDLLSLVGIRSRLSYASLRTSVSDKSAFNELIGFSHNLKRSRVAVSTRYGNGDKSGKMPPDLAARVGLRLKNSPRYIGYGSEAQSAMIRIRKGSSSYDNAVKYLDKMFGNIPEDLDSDLRYRFSQVTALDQTDEFVDMFDIEVFDGDHAFSANGVIVHNSSADITKIGMVYVNRLIRERGWQGKVMMLMTIHDELVFEIDLDILEEACDEITKAMTRNPMVLSLKWPIPLTSDTELGPNWTVKYNLIAMRKGEKEWPDWLAPYFKQKKLTYYTSPSQGHEFREFHLGDLKAALEEKAVGAVAGAVADSVSTAAVAAAAAVVLEESSHESENKPSENDNEENPLSQGGEKYLIISGGEIVIRLPRLDLGFLNDLAYCIDKADGTGKIPVKFVMDNGEDVTNEFIRYFKRGLRVDVEVLRAVMKTRDFV
jgi:hypothetical protein